MFNQRIFSCVKITLDGSTVLTKSQQLRKVQIYSVNGLNGIQAILRISKNEPNGSYLEFNMKNLYSIHRKLIEEGKATFVFREQKGHGIIQGTFSTTMQLKDLQEVYETTHVYLYQCQPQNLKIFVDTIIQFLQNKKKNNKSPNKNSNINQKNSNVNKTNNELKKQLQQKRGRIQLEKRKLKDVFENGQFKIEKKKSCNHLSNLRQRQDWIKTILGSFVFKFLQSSEKKQLSVTCKSLANSYDSQKNSYVINNSNPPMFLIKKVLQRFYNLKKLKFSKNCNLKLPKDFFNYLKLQSLQKLDIAKCGGLCEKYINQILNVSSNLTSIKLPQQNLQYSNILYFNKMNQQIRTLKLKKNQYQCKDTESKQHSEFLIMYFKENQNLKNFHINKIQDKLFCKVLLLCQNFTKLQVLKIDELYMDSSNVSKFFEFVAQNKNIKKLAINQIYDYNYMNFEFNEIQIQIVKKTFKRLKHIKTFYFGEWIQNYILEVILKVFEKNQIQLKKVKIQRAEATDDYLQQILQQQRQIEFLDIHKCQNLNGQSLKCIDETFVNLKTIKVKLDDFRIKFLKQQLERNNLRQCKIIRVIQIINNDLILLGM